jgi:hypothetical protein
MNQELGRIAAIVKSPSWHRLKEYLLEKENNAIQDMARTLEVNSIYEARGRYKLIQEMLRLENIILESKS